MAMMVFNRAGKEASHSFQQHLIPPLSLLDSKHGELQIFLQQKSKRCLLEFKWYAKKVIVISTRVRRKKVFLTIL